jgi:Domain of unknown function (DUF4157)
MNGKSQTSGPEQAVPPVAAVTKQPERPAKAAGPTQVMSKATGSAAAPPPNGGFSIANAANMLSGQQGPGAATRAGVMRTLQRSVGNHRAGSLTQNTPPSISRTFARSTVCRKCGCESGGGAGGCAGCREKQLQRQAKDPATPSAIPQSVQNVVGGSSGMPLQRATRDHMENAFGTDFGGVRVHTDSQAARAANDINAEAFTHGQDIFFGANRFQPDTSDGQRLLAHELTHTIQQRNSAPAPAASDLSISHPDDAQEVEAEQVANRVVARSMASPVSVSPVPPVSVSPATSGQIHRYTWDDLENDVADVGESVSDVAQDVGSTVSSGVDTVVEGAAGAVQTVGEAAQEGLDWLATEAGQTAQALAAALGVAVKVTPAGLAIDVPGFCPLDAMVIPVPLPLPELSRDFTVSILKFPLGPDLYISGDVGLVATLEPSVQVQAGPLCLGGVHILINPSTSNYSISGSVSLTTATSLSFELRGGVLGQVNVNGIIPVGGVPVPVSVPIVSVEGGLAGKIQGTSAQTTTIGGGLGYSSGLISLSAAPNIDMGLALDLFAGAYAQLTVREHNVCGIYWQPYEWHGDKAFSLGTSISLLTAPGSGPPSVSITVAPPSLAAIPFSNIPLAISREGFSDECLLKDALCLLLKELGYLPSLHGGSWGWTGPYGPGKPLDGPLDVYERKPPRPSDSECRGACGPDCLTCDHKGTHHHVDPVTGEIWEYTKFEDCDTNVGCREHDAGFDWAAAVKGETGTWAIIMPWHMAANVECMCNYPAGNCFAWIAGLPPYDGKMFFAESATQIGGPTPPIGPPIGPPPPIGPFVGGDTCSNPLTTEFDIDVDGRTRKVKYKDPKHTQMAKRTVQNMVDIAGVASCDKDLTEPCEQIFCIAAKAKDKVYGSQIDKNTRRESRIEALLEQAWEGEKPPSSGPWEVTAEDDDEVGFDIDITGGTTRYRVKTNVTTGGKVFTETHLFPED